MLIQTLFLLASTVAFSSTCIADNSSQVRATTESGSFGTVVNESDNTFHITGGSRPNNGSNIFHSFSRFNINSSDNVVFENDRTDLHTTNIISRVTDSLPSTINGTIKTNGFKNINLFVINNKGLIFGENSQLDIEGSFHATTANYLDFSDQDKSRFYSDIGQGSTLTSEPISAYGFMEQSGNIQLNSSTFIVDKGESISLDAPSILLSNATIEAGNIDISGQLFNMDASNMFATAIEGKTGINIVVEKAVIANGSEINSGTTSDMTGGDITIKASESVTVSGFRTTLFGTIIPTILRSVSSGNSNAGHVIIESPSINLTDGAQISAESFGISGNSGNIRLNVDHLVMNSGAQIHNSTSAGSGGDITVRALDGIKASNILELIGNGKDGTGIFSITQSHNQAGNIDLTANTILLDNTEINASSNASPAVETPGKSGNIRIQTLDSLSLANTSSINITTDQANAGDINITTGRLLQLDENSQITSSVGGGDGKGGDIRITSEFVVLDGGSEITATANNGLGGEININADFLFNSPNSLISAKSSGNIDGIVAVTAPDENIISSTLTLSDTYLNMPNLSANPCASRTGSNGNSLIIHDSSGIAAEPDSMLSASTANLNEPIPPVSLQTISETIVLSELKCSAPMQP